MSQDDGPSKKAVHVKWAGKTIALGTFPSAEADEKCARAKALTRAWRSTMRPKPTREWVMGELERLGVRIVSGKLGRKADDDEKERSKAGGAMSADAMSSMNQDHIGQQRRPSNLGLGSTSGGGTLGGMPPATSGGQVNQHYEMLKLHHMNLLQELHETTMMMNMYQQQQLQQEQLRIQQAQNDPQLGQGSLGGGMDQLYGGGSGLSQRGSLGLGIGPRGSLGLGAGMNNGLGGANLKSQLDARIGGLKNDFDGKDNLGLGGLKRPEDSDGNGGSMKRQKMNSDGNS